MRRNMIDTTSGGETNAAVQSMLLYQGSIAFLETFAHINESDARLDEGLGVVTNLSVDFGGVTEFGVEVGLEAFGGAKFLGGDAMGVGFERMGLDFALWKFVGGEEVDDGYGWWFGLTVGDVVVGEGAFVEHSALSFVGGRSFGYITIGCGCLLLFLLLFVITSWCK